MAVRTRSLYSTPLGATRRPAAGRPSAAYLSNLSADPRQAIAQSLLQAGADQSPTYSNTVGIGRLLAGALGGYKAGKVRREYEGQDAAMREAYARALGAPSRDEAIGILGGADPEAGLTLRAKQWEAQDAAEKYRMQQAAELQQKIDEATNPQIQAAKLAVAQAMGGARSEEKLGTMIPPVTVGPDGKRMYAPVLGNPFGGLEAPAPASETPKAETALQAVQREKIERELSGAPNAKQMGTAKDKLNSLAPIRAQLETIKQKRDEIRNSLSSGAFGQGYLPTEQGKAFDKAVDQLKPLIRQLTRTPGEGSISNYEGKLAEIALPMRTDYESVTDQSIQGIEQLLDTIESGYKGIAAPASNPASEPGLPPTLEGRVSAIPDGQPIPQDIRDQFTQGGMGINIDGKVTPPKKRIKFSELPP